MVCERSRVRFQALAISFLFCFVVVVQNTKFVTKFSSPYCNINSFSTIYILQNLWSTLRVSRYRLSILLVLVYSYPMPTKMRKYIKQPSIPAVRTFPSWAPPCPGSLSGTATSPVHVSDHPGTLDCNIYKHTLCVILYSTSNNILQLKKRLRDLQSSRQVTIQCGQLTR